MAVAKRIKERLGHEMQPDTLEPTLTVSAITAMPGCRKLRKIGVAGLRLTSKELVRAYRAVLHYFVRLRCAFAMCVCALETPCAMCEVRLRCAFVRWRLHVRCAMCVNKIQ